MSGRSLLIPLLLIMILSLPACQLGGSPASPDEPATPAAADETNEAGGESQTEGGESQAGGSEGSAGETGGESAAEAPTEVPPTATTAPSPTPTEVPDELAEIDPGGQTVRFLHPFADERGEALAELAAEFSESNEQGITVVAEPVTATGALASDAEAGLLAGSRSGIAEMLEDTEPVDLTPYLSSRSWGVEESMAGMEEGAPVNMLPLSHSTLVLYYNQELLEELGFDAPPQEWEELGEMACAAAESGQTGAALAYTMDPTEPGRFHALLLSQGETGVTEEGTVALDTPGAAEIVGLLQSLYLDGCLAPVTESSRTLVEFATGALLFAIDSSWSLSEYASAIEAGYGGEWAVAALPYASSEPAQSLATLHLALPEGSPEQQLAAWLFAKWLTAPEQQGRWAELTDALPTSPESLGGDASEPLQRAAELVAVGQPEPAIPQYDMLQLLMDDALAQMIEGADVAETLTDIEDEINMLLEASSP